MNQSRLASWLTLAAISISAGFAVGGGSAEAATSHSCGRVIFGSADGPAGEWVVHMRVRGVSCKLANRVAQGSLFGQGAAPPFGWHCHTTGSGSGRCTKGVKRLAYATDPRQIPRL
jgi:hypothetical protein